MTIDTEPPDTRTDEQHRTALRGLPDFRSQIIYACEQIDWTTRAKANSRPVREFLERLLDDVREGQRSYISSTVNDWLKTRGLRETDTDTADTTDLPVLDAETIAAFDDLHAAAFGEHREHRADTATNGRTDGRAANGHVAFATPANEQAAPGREVAVPADRAAVVRPTAAPDTEGADLTEGLAAEVARAEARLPYQSREALLSVLSEAELREERELAERLRAAERREKLRDAEAADVERERDRRTTRQLRAADHRDAMLARKAVAAQRRATSPHAKLASLYRHRTWSLTALAGVVAGGMCWSAVNVQHNIAPHSGMADPLYWFSYLIEALISVTLIVIMIGTNKVAEWGIVDDKTQVALAELGLLGLTVCLNTYPYWTRAGFGDMWVHAIAPFMIGIALVVHHWASTRYGRAIGLATAQLGEVGEVQVRSWDEWQQTQ